MTRLASMLLALLLAQGDETPASDAARDALRPSLVEVCQRGCGYLKSGDWKRARLSLATARPLARALDARWPTGLAPDLEAALDAQDVRRTLDAVLTLVCWDARDLLHPFTTVEELDSRQAKTRLLKAREDLRYLAPLIKAKRPDASDPQREDGRVVYARLEQTLANMAGYLPSDRKYGQNLRWREDLRLDAARLLQTFSVVLPELHDRPASTREVSK